MSAGGPTGGALERLAGSRARLAVCAALVALVAAAWIATAADDPGLAPWERWTRPVFAANAGATALLAAALVVLLPGRNASRRARRIAAAALGLGAVLLVLESAALVLGHDWRATLGTLGPEDALRVQIGANRLDPELIHVHHPNTGFRGRVRGNLALMGIPGEPYEVDVRYDSNGFRNDRDLERADVAVIGDSFVEAAILPREVTVSARIEGATGLVTANLGQAAYGFRQELAVLRRYALPLEPRVVVWLVFGGNDFRDVEGYDELRAAYDRLEEIVATPLAERTFTWNAVRRLEQWLEPDGLSELARRHSGLFPRADGDGHRDPAEGGAETGERERVFFRRHEGDWEPFQLEVAAETLAEAARLCAEADARLLVLYVPRKFRVYDGLVDLEPDAVCRGWTSNDLPRRLGERCAELGIAWRDTTPALRARVAAGEHVYLLDDVHWNARGHAVAAEVALGAARELGWLGEEPP